MRHLSAHPIVGGAALGIAWGSVMRLWMRYISTDPEFSWGGTIAIVAVSAFAGAVLGLARLRRAQAGAGWWRLSLLALLPMGAGGSAMWPAVVLGAIALGRPRPTWFRVAMAAGALATQVPVINDAAFGNWRLGTGEAVLATLWYLPMLAIDMWAFSVVFAPAATGAPALTRTRKMALAVPIIGVGLFTAIAAGLVRGM
ncbi:MAG: hypothetical protein ACFCVC_20125 [Acidimicrobiia bacterium]